MPAPDSLLKLQNAPSVVSGTELCNYFPTVSLGGTICRTVCVTATSAPSHSASVPSCSFSFCLYVSVYICVCVFQVFKIPHLSPGCPLFVPYLNTPAPHLLISCCSQDTCLNIWLLLPLCFVFRLSLFLVTGRDESELDMSGSSLTFITIKLL